MGRNDAGHGTLLWHASYHDPLGSFWPLLVMAPAALYSWRKEKRR